MSAGVVVGVDGSPAADAATAHALRTARRTGGDLVVVHVWHRPSWSEAAPAADPTATARDRAQHRLDEAVARALAADPEGQQVRLRALLVEGDPGAVLTDLSADVDLLVLGRSGHRHLAGALLGSTVRHALGHSRCPVVVVPPGVPAAAAPRQVVVGFDGSPTSEATLHWARDAALRESCPLRVLHSWQVAGLPPHGVLRPPELVDALGTVGRASDAWARPLALRLLGDTGELPVTVDLVHGGAAASLLGAVGPEDLLVVGPRGHGGFPALLLGSVATQAAEHAPCPVVVVR